MKKTTVGIRLLSFAVCFCLLLALFPAAVEAESSDRVVYFVNADNWSTVKAYTWNNGTEHLGGWPGSAMTKVEGKENLYCITVPADAVNIIFHNGSGTQTSNLTVPTNDNCFTYNRGWSYICQHSYKETVTTAPTCTAAGVRTFTCSDCGDQYTEAVAATGHSFVDGICADCGVSKADSIMTIYFQNNWLWSNVSLYFWGSSTASCAGWPGNAMSQFFNDGTYDIYKLDVPSDVAGIIINGVKNDGSNTIDKTPDINSGWFDGICYYMMWDNGNAVGYENISTMLPCDHSYTERVTREPSCTDEGVKTFTCSGCGNSYTETIPAVGHSYVGGKCTNCGEAEPVGTVVFFVNSNQWDMVYAYTWTDGTEQLGKWPGSVMRKVEDEADLYRVTVPAGAVNIIFNNGNGVQTDNLTLPAQDNCFTYNGDWSYVDPCEHSFESAVTTAPTCTSSGVMTLTCANCGKTKVDQIPALPHTFVDGICTACGGPEVCVEHTWDNGEVISEKTCWTDGSVLYTCIYCRATETRTQKGGHEFYYEVTKEPTCTAMGKQATKCYHCAYIADRYLPKLEHSYVAGEVVAPTCTTDGYTVHTCAACGDTAKLNLVDMLGHSWNGNTCSVCGTICNHTLIDGICYNCGKGGPVYENGYYEIANAAELKWFAAQINGGNNGINGKLVDDIDLNNATWTSIGHYCKDGDANNSVAYTGIFDGQGYKVSNFNTAGTDNEGLFGYTSSATIRNLGIVNARVTGWRAGAVVGYALTSTIENCYAVDCTINGSTSNAIALQSGSVYIAPITSPQSGTVRNCYALNCALVDRTSLSIETAPVGGLIRSNQYYCNVSYSASFYWTTGATEVTAAQMASGEVAYKLGEGWGQRIGTDSAPVPFGEKVYFENGSYFNKMFAITQKGRTLSYQDLIYVIDIFDLTGVEGIDLSKDAGLLIWSVEEFEALSEIAFDAEHAKVGLSPYKQTDYYFAASDGIFTRDLYKEAYYVGYVKLGDGSYIYSEPKLYSPAVYAYNMLDKESTSPETRALCVALLNYISAAQMYFDKTTPADNLVNADLTDEQKALNWENISFNLAPEIPADKQVARDEAVFTRNGKNLLFEEMISIVSIYMVDDGIVADAAECGSIYWTAEQFAALEGAPGIDNIGAGTKTGMAQYRGNAGQWYSLAPEVAAKDMADTQYYYLGYIIHADGSVSYSGVQSYTIEQYISNTIDKESTSAEMCALAQWLYVYERAAEAALK